MKNQTRWWSLRPLLTSRRGQELSLSKITMIIGISFSCYIMHKLTVDGRMTAEYFMIFVGATFGANSLNKAISVFGERERRYYDEVEPRGRYANTNKEASYDDIVENIK